MAIIELYPKLTRRFIAPSPVKSIYMIALAASTQDTDNAPHTPHLAARERKLTQYHNSPLLLSSSSADNRHVSTTLHLYVHCASLAPRNRIFINLWRPNAEDVEVTIFMVVYSVFIAGRG